MKTTAARDAVGLIADGATRMIGGFMGPLTSARAVDPIVTDLAVIAQEDGRLRLLETAPGVGVEQVLAATGARLDVAADVRTMRVA